MAAREIKIINNSALVDLELGLTLKFYKVSSQTRDLCKILCSKTLREAIVEFEETRNSYINFPVTQFA